MAEQAQARSVALFYYFSILDDPTAQAATLKTIHYLKKQLKSHWAEVSAGELISHLNHSFKKSKWKRGFKIKASLKSGWVVPENIELGAWKHFKKEALEEEFLAVIFSKILGFSDEDISLGLDITQGTLRYRLNRGLSLLSHTVKGDSV